MEAGKAEQMLLHWNNFHSSVAARFHEFQQREELVDVTIAVRGGSVQAHKLLLSACSPYLKRLLEASPCEHPVLILKDMGRRELLSILEFMYCGEVRVEQDDLEAFLQAAEVLQVKGLTGGQGKTEEDSAATPTTTTTTTTKQESPQKQLEVDDDNQKCIIKQRPKHTSRKRKRSENAAEQGCAASASKGARTDTSSSTTDDDSNGANNRVDLLGVPKQKIELVDIITDSDPDTDAEEISAAVTPRNKANYSNYCDDMSTSYLVDSSDGLQLIQRQRGYPQLVYTNFIFNCQLYDGNHVYWVCQDNYKFNCRASVVTIHNRVINAFGAKHNHDNHEQEVEEEMLKGNFRVQPLRRDMFLEVHTNQDQSSSPLP